MCIISAGVAGMTKSIVCLLFTTVFVRRASIYCTMRFGRSVDVKTSSSLLLQKIKPHRFLVRRSSPIMEWREIDTHKESLEKEKEGGTR